MLHVKQDSEELIPSFSDFENDFNSSSRDKIIRRRSSKACDQCRRTKSKCMKLGDQPCQNCATLGVECTFLGPSRKRGPAKGYLSDLELKLHQMEALLGVLLASQDPRASSLIADVSKDSVAREILNRVDTSLLGTHPHDQPGGLDPRVGNSSVGKRISTELADSTHEWQRHLSQIISRNSSLGSEGTSKYSLSMMDPTSVSQHPLATITSPSSSLHTQLSNQTGSPNLLAPRPFRPAVTVDVPRSDSRSSGSPSRLRRVDVLTPITAGSPIAPGGSSGPLSDGKPRASSASFSGRDTPEYSDSEDINDALGQLSLDDASQIRYHGKASGLHLLGETERADNRAEGGIWRFPPARVWPATERPIERARDLYASDFGVQLPTREQQAELLDIYFAHVNPCFPLFDRASFMRAWSMGIDESTEAPPVPTFVPSRLPIPLMLVIFSIALRLSADNSPGPAEGTMSTTGDEYLSAAKYMMTANPYAASRPATCQAYLLIAYREIGIGAMSQAWLFLGVGIRMAQDLGLHRSIEKFHELMSSLFAPAEREARNRVWACCMILDRYVSTYIGRPCMIFERDYDTPPPIESSSEAAEVWLPHPSRPRGAELSAPPSFPYVPVASNTFACLSASFTLSSLLGQIVESLYSLKQVVPSRHAEAARIEKQLDKFYLDLPHFLKFDGSNQSSPPPPHILTFNMQYWNTVLLLHRPFIHRRVQTRRESPDSLGSPADSETLRTTSQRALKLCKTAARNVGNIAEVYQTAFCLLRSSPFLCYYVFNAAIMHVVALTSSPEDASETHRYLHACMETLRGMSALWPSAGRGWDLINGCRPTPRSGDTVNAAISLLSRRQEDTLNNNRTSLPSQAQAVQSQRTIATEKDHNRLQSSMSQEGPDGYRSFSTNNAQPVNRFTSNEQSPSPLSRPFAGPANGSYAPWSGNSDTSFVRSTFNNPSATHSRNPSLGSQRDPPRTLPHFWSDPFTDASLLSSNYYGVPVMERQVPTATDSGSIEFAPLNYAPYQGGY